MFNNLHHRIYKVLRYSEKYTQTDMVYLAKGSFWLTLGQVAGSFAAFILAIAFANFLSPETYGDYKYVISIVSILAIFTLPNMSIAFIRSVSRGQEGNIEDIIKKKIQWGLIASFFALIFALYYFLKNDNYLAITFVIASLFLPIFNTFKIFNIFCHL
jgi:O-antigen/teichoic acid export membrane protein